MSEPKPSPDGESRQDSDPSEREPHTGKGAASAFECMKEWVRQRSELAEAQGRDTPDRDRSA